MIKWKPSKGTDNFVVRDRDQRSGPPSLKSVAILRDPSVH